jgi:hypothetical protein
VARRWHDRSAFLPDRSALPPARPSRRQALALVAVLALAAGGAALASWLLTPGRAQAFDLFRGSVYIDDARAPVSVDLASGKPTVRLRQANQQVGATDASDLAVFPLQGGTLLLDRVSGEFNMVDGTGFVIKRTGGVPLPSRGTAAVTSAQAVPAGPRAFIVRTGGASTDVYLVGQATVQAAAAPHARVTPRAYRTIRAQLAPGDGSLASANGELWALSGLGDTHRLWQLVLPPGSGNGAQLSVASARTLHGPAAVGVATVNTDGSGGDVLALATADHIDLTLADGATRTVRYPLIPGLDTLLPASNQHGRVAFLYHATAGWGLVSVGVDGHGLKRPRLLTGMGPDAAPAAPAASRGALYTVERDSGAIVKITYAARWSRVASYPLATRGGMVLEAHDFADTYLIARGARVIADSPNHVFALTLFTDGSGPPLRIDKNAAVDVNAAGAVDALAKAPGGRSGGPAPPKQKTPVPPAQPVNNAIDCTKTTQVPHVPVITAVDPGSRSVHLEWTYPTLDPQDCVPSTYTLAVQAVSADAPSPPGTVTVQGQRAVNLVGLFPSTQYEITLTAYIHGRGTSALPVLVTTGPEGPAAPTGVSAEATPDGNWAVTWHTCGGVQHDCVPATSWDVLPSFCDGLAGLAEPLQPLNVIGDPTLHTFTATYSGGGQLLGRSLSFIVQGRGDAGTKGTPSAPSGCTQSWSVPVAGEVSIDASQPASTAVGGTSATTVTVNLGPDAQRAIGGIGGTVTFQLTGPDGTQTKRVGYDGRTSVLTATFSGLAPGAAYSASALLAPPGHPSAAVTVGPVTVSASAQWPAGLAVSASCPASGGVVQLGCQLVVTFTGLSSADARGESFDLTDQSRLQCGQRAQQLTRNGFDPGSDTVTAGVSLIFYHGDCTVYAQLIESGSDTDPKYFGGTPSPVLTTSLTLGQATTLDAKASDFVTSWSGPPGSHVVVRYGGTYDDATVGALTQNWHETVLAPDGSACGSDDEQPTRAGITFDASAACVDAQPSDGWTVTISYDDAGTSDTHTLTRSLKGPPPGYVPCTIDKSAFGAQWAGTHAQPSAALQFTGKDTDLAGCSGWTYTLHTPGGDDCGTGPAGTAPDGPQPVTIAVSCSTAPDGAADWTITVGYQNPDQSHGSFAVTVSGSPP